MVERRVIDQRRTGPGRSGAVDPAMGVMVAVLLLALIGLLIWFFAVRSNDSAGSSRPQNNPNPGTSQPQQTQDEQPTEQPTATSTP